MDPGLSGLLGALLGASAAFGAVMFAQWRLEVREKRQRRREAAESALISTRILLSELAWAEARVGEALTNGKYWSARYALELDAWHSYREQMAVVLQSAVQWSTLRDGYRAVRTLELQASKRREDEFDKAPVSDWGTKQLRHGQKRIEAAINVLAPLANDRPREPMGRDPALKGTEPAIDD